MRILAALLLILVLDQQVVSQPEITSFNASELWRSQLGIMHELSGTIDGLPPEFFVDSNWEDWGVRFYGAGLLLQDDHGTQIRQDGSGFFVLKLIELEHEGQLVNAFIQDPAGNQSDVVSTTLSEPACLGLWVALLAVVFRHAQNSFVPTTITRTIGDENHA